MKLLVEKLIKQYPKEETNFRYDPVRQINVLENGKTAIEDPECIVYMKTKTLGGGSSED